jgi:hypothetical protein
MHVSQQHVLRRHAESDMFNAEEYSTEEQGEG